MSWSYVLWPGRRWGSKLTLINFDYHSSVGPSFVFQGKSPVAIFDVSLMSWENGRNPKVFSRGTDFFRKSRFRGMCLRPKKSLIPNIKPNIEIVEPFLSQNKI